MNATLAGFLYLLAAILFILGLKRLSSPATAKDGNRMAALGMLVAVIVTLLDQQIVSYWTIIAGLVVGAAIGGVLAQRVEMTAMPQLVAAFNGFGGGASAFVAMAELIRGGSDLVVRTLVSIGLSVLIGSITFSGSFVAFGKLQGILSGKPIVLPLQKAIDGILAVAAVAAFVAISINGAVAAAWLLFGLALHPRRHPDDAHRWRRHARRDLLSQLAVGSGGLGRRIRDRLERTDHLGRPRGSLRAHPHEHHGEGDEPHAWQRVVLGIRG